MIRSLVSPETAITRTPQRLPSLGGFWLLASNPLGPRGRVHHQATGIVNGASCTVPHTEPSATSARFQLRNPKTSPVGIYT